jgi:hypothetical protein
MDGGGKTSRRAGLVGWAIDLAVGISIGGTIGAITAVNIVIFSGVDDGYQASVSQVFDERPVAGVLAFAALLAVPTLMVRALRQRRRR